LTKQLLLKSLPSRGFRIANSPVDCIEFFLPNSEFVFSLCCLRLLLLVNCAADYSYSGKQAGPNHTEQQRDADVRKAVEPVKNGFYSYQREEEE
jgi:hypothetical protein